MRGGGGLIIWKRSHDDGRKHLPHQNRGSGGDVNSDDDRGDADADADDGDDCG